MILSKTSPLSNDLIHHDSKKSDKSLKIKLSSFFKKIIREEPKSTQTQPNKVVINSNLSRSLEKKSTTPISQKNQTIPNSDNVSYSSSSHTSNTESQSTLIDTEKRVTAFLFSEEKHFFDSTNTLPVSDLNEFSSNHHQNYNSNFSHSEISSSALPKSTDANRPLTSISDAAMVYRPNSGKNKFLNSDDYSFEEELDGCETKDLNNETQYHHVNNDHNSNNNNLPAKIFIQTTDGKIFEKPKLSELENFKFDLRLILNELKVEIVKELEFGFNCKHVVEIGIPGPFQPTIFFEVYNRGGNIRFRRNSGDERLV
ncbi:hypothetical protein HK099_003213 [Clydaea vesicula]|uniref:Uncharacterized protein n=1 Tax=Clydaea vesicula TaxID=447962 RepID=A0AAD5TSI7_9FUNG|nr:hypothetical protein HK099_003213 [Clydaea vesicula]